MVEVIVIRMEEKSLGKYLKSGLKTVLSKIFLKKTEKNFELTKTRINVNIFNGKVDGDERIMVFNPIQVAKEYKHKYYVPKVRRIDIEDGILWLNKNRVEMYGTLYIFYGLAGHSESPEAEILTDNEDIIYVPQY